ncbi:MAG: cell division protein FtsX, partial [Prevotella sp.]
DYANGDSLKWIAKELKSLNEVTDVAYQEDLMDKVNSNLRKLGVILLVLAVLLTCVSFSLINNSVRLSIYSRRFLIHTMKLVGASWGFIRRPFIKRAVGVGLVAALLACAALGGGMYALYNYEPNIIMVITWRELAFTAASVFFFGVVITALCSWLSVNKFLKMTAGELYKI